MRLAAEHIRQKPDYYVLHEYLEDTNEALYFEDFIDRATAAGLRYLADSDVRTMLSIGLPSEIDATLNRIAPGLMRREQFLDFLRSRSFRQSLLIREGATLDRKLSPARVMALRIAAPVRSDGVPVDMNSDRVASFRLSDGRTVDASQRIAKAALAILASQWPLPIPFDHLYEQAKARLGALAQRAVGDRDTLASEIFRLHLNGAAELHRAAPPFVLAAGSRPEAGAVARRDSSRTTVSANLRHEPVPLEEGERALLPLLDGTRPREEIAALHWPSLPDRERLARLEATLASLGRQALLVR